MAKGYECGRCEDYHLEGVANSDLRNLVTQWRDRVSHNATTTLDRSANIALRNCADELEELIDE